jgi:hypothetical protein
MDFMKTLGNAQTLLGLNQDGGGNRKKSPRKVRRVRKMKKAMRPKKYRIGFFGGASRHLVCNEYDPPPVAGPVPPVPAAPAPPGQNGGRRHKRRHGGGKAMKKSAIYKKMLEKMTVDKLLKKAVKKGIKITKKKDGKTVYLKKKTLIRKLCKCKFGRSM